MKNIAIIGIGLGGDTITIEAQNAIERAEVLLGAPRALAAYNSTKKPSHASYLPKDVAEVIGRESAREFAVLVSGDVGFYSATTALIEALHGHSIRLIPGISTVNAFFARLLLPWQDAVFISVHGRQTDIVGAVRRNRLTFCLVGGNASELGATLAEAGLGGTKTHVGENLGTEQERIYTITANELVGAKLPSLAVLLFTNDGFDAGTPCGLPDSSFARLKGIPMTKSETRAVIMSKLCLHPTDICWDIGAGTGSVTVEMALNAHRGHVYAIERREGSMQLIDQNCAAFHLGNVTTICGEAPEALAGLPVPDAVFIGGSGGALGEIIAAILGKNRNARIVVTAITLETVLAALTALESAGLMPEIIQMNITRAKPVGVLHMMEAQNPVTILSAGGRSAAGGAP